MRIGGNGQLKEIALYIEYMYSRTTSSGCGRAIKEAATAETPEKRMPGDIDKSKLRTPYIAKGRLLARALVNKEFLDQPNPPYSLLLFCPSSAAPLPDPLLSVLLLPDMTCVKEIALNTAGIPLASGSVC